MKTTLDSGAEINLIKQSIAHQIAVPVLPTTQIAYQANGVTPMDVVGETHLEFSWDDKSLLFQALVVKELDVDILAGIPFMVTNDIAIRPAKCQIIFKDGSSCFYGQKLQPQSAGAIRLTMSGILRSNSKCTLWPGDYLELFAPPSFEDDQALAIEPRTETAPQISESWPSPGLVTSVAGKIRIPNSLNVPLSLKRHEHIGKVCRTFDPLATPSITTCTPNRRLQPLTILVQFALIPIRYYLPTLSSSLLIYTQNSTHFLILTFPDTTVLQVQSRLL